jgi:peptidoglycan/xylan/chitin deacetylase (PgdA/CDA1 family)
VNLLAVMYHRALPGPYGNSPVALDAHFAHVARHCDCVLPGEPLAGPRLKVCLTFDDAYADFYSVVFPLLQTHGLRAMLAVPPAVINEQAGPPASNPARGNADRAGVRGDQDLHCSWAELEILAASGQVAIAAHGLSHARLDRREADLDAEILIPRVMLSARLRQPVDSFFFPFGRFSGAALRKVKQHYRYAFRIGGAANPDWSGSVLYRVSGDCLAAPDALFSPARLAIFRMRFYWNRLRRR